MKLVASFIFFLMSVSVALADGIVSAVTSAPIHPNGIVTNERAGLNIHLQTEDVQGLDFMDPATVGYGLLPGGSLEVELVSGFQRDPNIPLDDKSILLVVGTPQQGLPAALMGFSISQGENENTFVIRSENANGANAEDLISPAPGAAFDPVRARGIKIIHVGRNKAFVTRGDRGVVAVRFKDKDGSIVAEGWGEVAFFPKPRPVIYPTNIPHDQRNHNWQRVPVGNIVGVASKTLPVPLMLYMENEGLKNEGIIGAGVLSTEQLQQLGFELPEELERFTAGLILRDSDGDQMLVPGKDEILGGVIHNVPEEARGHQVLTPLVNERPFLSVETSRFNERAGANIGGAIMQVVYIAGDIPGVYRAEFVLLEEPGNIESANGSSVTYSIVVE